MDQTQVVQDSSGIIAIYGVEQASQYGYLALHAIQHRGQDGVGLAVSDGKNVKIQKGLGLVNENMSGPILEQMTGYIAVGQVRMATDGDSALENVQPTVVRAHQGSFAIATTGMITDAVSLREELEDDGLIFQGTGDGELIAHLIQWTDGKFVDKIRQACKMGTGACSFVIATKDHLYVYRDRYGVHSISMGKLKDGYVFSSETSSFTILQAEYIRDVKPGELIVLDENGVRSIQLDDTKKQATCAMEYVYFARPDSIINGVNVHQVRKLCGYYLAKQEDVDADFVIGTPDSASSAAASFARNLGKPYEIGLIKNRYIGSTFIHPTQEQREQGMRVRLNAISSVVRGKKILLVDDSVVYGLTARRVSQLLHEAGAKEVHLRIASPIIKYPCFYGYEKTEQKRLAGFNYTEEEMRQYFNVDTLRFMSLEDFKKCIPETSCLACFNGVYPSQLADYERKVEE
ncbi:MAG: amidophosphoribosyltransferase [Catenisphaera adipataccumulans]|jgi:amidophosphoribosyltransferase|uniref:amidophosphoribosyltransferase n=1 Tax=Catenisphaera adipataccumulans TaxID=700500 RepID=UPI003D8C8EF2